MNNINDQIRKIIKDAGFEGGLFANYLCKSTEWRAHQSDRPLLGYRAYRQGSAETPEAAIAACMAAQWVLEKEDAK